MISFLVQRDVFTKATCSAPLLVCPTGKQASQCILPDMYGNRIKENITGDTHYNFFFFFQEGSWKRLFYKLWAFMK